MICRAMEDGWLLITQIAHAWMAGELAAVWGNDDFAAPEPLEAILLATRLHDIGWLDWDAAPRLDELGQPVDFLDLTLDETILIWRHGVRHVRMLNPYAALLVSMHATTVYRRRMERGADPTEQRSIAQEVLDEQTAIRAEVVSSLSSHAIYGPAVLEDRLSAIYRWLRACDLLSLAVLSDKLSPVGEISAVPGRDLADQKVIRYNRQNTHTLALDPWPFTHSGFQLVVEARLLRQKKFAGQAQFHSALATAEWRPITVTLRPLHSS